MSVEPVGLEGPEEGRAGRWGSMRRLEVTSHRQCDRRVAPAWALAGGLVLLCSFPRGCCGGLPRKLSAVASVSRRQRLMSRADENVSLLLMEKGSFSKGTQRIAGVTEPPGRRLALCGDAY